VFELSITSGQTLNAVYMFPPGKMAASSLVWLSVRALLRRDCCRRTPAALELWRREVRILRPLSNILNGKGPFGIPADQATFLRNSKHLAPVFQAQATDMLVNGPVHALAFAGTVGRRAASTASL
jgi:hypothetical protein